MTTEQEKKVLNSLIQAHNEFIKMPAYHPSDAPEWVHHMHALQNIVMARQAVREEPEFFRGPTPMTPQQERDYDANVLAKTPHVCEEWESPRKW